MPSPINEPVSSVTTLLGEDERGVQQYASLRESLSEILKPSSNRYRDFSHVLPPDGYKAPTTTDDMNFAQKVHHMLSEPDFQYFITWMPHGRAFKVLVPQLFEIHVCPQYFGHRSYAQFRRDLHENGFKHIPSGRDQNGTLPYTCLHERKS